MRYWNGEDSAAEVAERTYNPRYWDAVEYEQAITERAWQIEDGLDVEQFQEMLNLLTPEAWKQLLKNTMTDSAEAGRMLRQNLLAYCRNRAEWEVK
jgi:hypothetical protein